MRTLLEFEVAGEPAPQGSKTSVRTKAGAHVMREDNPKTGPWRNAIAAAARAALEADDGYRTFGGLFAGPLRLVLVFTFARPKAHFGSGRNAGRLKPSAPVYCDKRPDLDKLVRAVGDALTGVVVVDDAAFVELAASKRYGTPGVHVAIRSPIHEAT